MSSHSAASSLYSGIFSHSKSDGSNGSDNKQNEETTSTSPIKPLEGAEAKGINDKSQAWSAALRFTPRRNLTNNKPKRAPIQAHLSAAFSNSDIHSDSPGNKRETIDPSSSVIKDTREIESGSSVRSPQKAPETPENVLRSIATHGIHTHALNIYPNEPFKRPLPKILEPPPVALSVEEIERDRALFRDRALKRGENSSHPSFETWEQMDDAYDEEEDVNGFSNTAEGKKAKKRKRKRRSSPGRHGGLSASMNMDADYDPRIPNDFTEFSNLLIKRREDERKRRKGNKTEEDDFEGKKSDDERTNWNRFDKLGKFAPPTAYIDNSRTDSRMSKIQNDEEDDKPYLSPPPPGPPPVIPSSVKTGEDAYQRRVAMSQAMTGEEAYQQRLAMSQQTSADKEKTSNPIQSAVDLASRTAAAAAIAAKLAQIAPTSEVQSDLRETTTPSLESDPSTFAERLMMKQGWKKGEALGAEGNKGIIDPILARKVENERAKQMNKNGRGNDSSGSSSVRGTIINPKEQQKREEERQKYGEASEVILLENMVMNDEDIDDDLPEEIGEECEKYGKVERVFIWPAAHAKLPQFNKKSASNTFLAVSTVSAKPRIFVKFNGITSAWKCLKELDGRFFAGNTVRARYYPLQDFNRGNYDRLYD